MDLGKSLGFFESLRELSWEFNVWTYGTFLIYDSLLKTATSKKEGNCGWSLLPLRGQLSSDPWPWCSLSASLSHCHLYFLPELLCPYLLCIKSPLVPSKVGPTVHPQWLKHSKSAHLHWHITKSLKQFLLKGRSHYATLTGYVDQVGFELR